MAYLPRSPEGNGSVPSDALCHPAMDRADGTVALGLEMEAVLDTRQLVSRRSRNRNGGKWLGWSCGCGCLGQAPQEQKGRSGILLRGPRDT